MDKLDVIERDISNLSKNLESHTNQLYEIKFVLKELKLIDRFTDEKIQKAIDNLDKLNRYKDELIEKKDKEANKVKWFFITSFFSIGISIVMYYIKGK